MGESIITRKKGGVSIPQTELPVITFISLNDTSLTFTIRNEDDEQAIVYYELGDDTPDSASITLNGNTTSSNIVFSGLTPGTEYTLYVWATAFNKSVSQVVENTQTTTNTTVAPTITYVSKTFNSITFTVTNNDSATATVYYEENDDTPDANSVVLNAGQTSSNLTISGLTKQTSYTVYAQAQATGKLLSSAVSFTETTPDFPTLANPTITFVSASSDRIRITLKNNATVSADIYYEQGDTTPDENFITLGAGVTSGTIEVTGLNASTSYTIYAQAQQTNNNPSGVVSITNSTTAPQGQVVFTSSGTWTVPSGVTSASAFLVGGGGGGNTSYFFCCDDQYVNKQGGSGAQTGYGTFSVTPGVQYTITVGAGGSSGQDGGSSSIIRTSNGVAVAIVYGGQANGSPTGNTFTFNGTNTLVGRGGNAPSDSALTQYGVGQNVGGGGAGGYGGQGGGASKFNPGGAGTSGAGGGGYSASSSNPGQSPGSGGGVGLLGLGANGVGGTVGSPGGGAGSGGSGSNYGGGGSNFSGGGQGAVRIIWGVGRSYPSTNTGNV
jgi:hypothetical protein